MRHPNASGRSVREPRGTPREVRVGTSPFGNNCNGGSLMKVNNGIWESPWLPTLTRQVPASTAAASCWKAGETATTRLRATFGGQIIQMAYVAPNNTPLAYAAIRPPGQPVSCVGYANTLVKALQTVCVEVGLEPPLHQAALGASRRSMCGLHTAKALTRSSIATHPTVSRKTRNPVTDTSRRTRSTHATSCVILPGETTTFRQAFPHPTPTRSRTASRLTRGR